MEIVTIIGMLLMLYGLFGICTLLTRYIKEKLMNKNIKTIYMTEKSEPIRIQSGENYIDIHSKDILIIKEMIRLYLLRYPILSKRLE